MPQFKKKSQNRLNIPHETGERLRQLDSFFEKESSSSIPYVNDSIVQIIPDALDVLDVPNTLTTLELSNDININININNDIFLNNQLKMQKDTKFIPLSNIEIKNKVEKLTDDELTEVFKIIKGCNEKYSVNKNGIFINLNSLKKTTNQELSNFLFFCESNDKLFYEDEKNREIYKKSIRNL
jgi:hypothetical protein